MSSSIALRCARLQSACSGLLASQYSKTIFISSTKRLSTRNIAAPVQKFSSSSSSSSSEESSSSPGHNGSVESYGGFEDCGRNRTSLGHECRGLYPEHLVSAMLSGFLAPYWETCPSAEHAISEVEQWLPNAQVGFDHFAFRSFGLGGPDSGIASISTWFTDLGYTEGGSFEFVKKKLRARWYKPPSPDLPRLFVSELKVEEMSEAAQKIIKKYAGNAGDSTCFTIPHAFSKYGPATGFLGVTPWEPPTLEEYSLLLNDSEYGAWTLVNGYALNHCTIAVHKLAGLKGGIAALNSHLKQQGLTLSEEGGEIKQSPDGLLLQSSTVADRREFEFAGGEVVLVPGSYIEFAERLVLPEYQHLKGNEIKEWHRRDGFEAASADRIFESTTVAATKLKQNE